MICVICGHDGELVPFNGRDGRACSRCGSLERHRRAFEIISTLQPRSVLHVAPETCLQPILTSAERYESIDLHPSRGATQADLQRLPFADDSFDLVVASHVLEHVHDDLLAIKEVSRVLQPGGVALIQVPVSQHPHTEDDPIDDPEERRRRYGQRGHVRLYGQDVITRLAIFGLTVTDEGTDDSGRTYLARKGDHVIATRRTAPLMNVDQ